jgi:HlyD family secretion protein
MLHVFDNRLCRMGLVSMATARLLRSSTWGSLRLACLFSATIGGCRHEPNAAATSPNAIAEAGLQRVTVVKPQRTTLVATTIQPARIEAFEETPLYAKLPGFVKKVQADIGDRVTAGQTLVTLDIPELADDVAQKEALVVRAEAQVRQSTANIKAFEAAAETARAKIAETRAGVARSKAEYERWQSEFSRIQQLSDNGSVTQKLRDETLNQLSAAEATREETGAAVRSAEASAQQAIADIGKAEADAAAAEAQLQVAKSELARAKTMLSYREILAPYDGVVTRRTVDTGHFVQSPGGAAAKPLMTVARIDKVRVYIEVPEIDAAHVEVGDDVTLIVQALSGAKFQAKVARTSWSLDPANRTLRAEIDIDNDDASLRPGMYASGVIRLAQRENAITLPSSAVFRVDDAYHCCVVNEGAAERRRLEIGLRTPAGVEVVDGIDQNSAVVLAGGESLGEGQRVLVSDAAK